LSSPDRKHLPSRRACRGVVDHEDITDAGKIQAAKIGLPRADRVPHKLVEVTDLLQQLCEGSLGKRGDSRRDDYFAAAERPAGPVIDYGYLIYSPPPRNLRS
jgi:hypothetical protein